jgi:anti-sigma-K factor RskA
MKLDPKATAQIADEYVLGLLDTADALEFEAKLPNNAELRDAVAASRERFLPLDTSIQPSEIGSGLWTRIETNLSSVSTSSTDMAGGTATNPATNDNGSHRWRLATFASLAATLLLAVGLGWALTNRPEPVVIAVLLNSTGEPQAVVEDFGNEQATIRLLADFPVPQGKTLQVWTLPSREMGPISLGLLDERESATLRGPALPEPQDAQLYEITLEQAGGSPTGRPTGPILVKGYGRIPL